MKKVKIITIILAIILITLVAFGGVYIKTQNRMENKVKDYGFGRELNGGRVVEVKVVTGDEETTKTNPEDLTIENYEIVKKTIEERLKNFGAQDYTISLNKDNGTIRVELPEDNNIDAYIYLLTASSKVQIKEKDADTELLSDSMVEKALYTYTSDIEGEYEVFLELYLTEEGQTKIEEIKNNYAIFANEIADIEAAQSNKEATAEGEKTTEENTTDVESISENEEETKNVAVLTIAEREYDVEKIEKNKIRAIIGEKTKNSTSINNNIASATELAILINSGKMPLEYEIGDNRFVDTDITDKQLFNFAIAIAIMLLIVFIVFIIKYKTKGFLASVSFIGFISTLLLVLRYTNVNISIEGIGAIFLTTIINIRINQLILKDGKNIDYKDIALKLAPVEIITLVFCFAEWSNLSSFGLIMFWGLMMVAVYNIFVTKTLLKLKESK